MAKERKIKQCKSCGKELDKSAKTCPSCGKDQRGFFGRHKILTGLLVIIIVVIIAIATSPGEDTTPEGEISASKLTLAYDKNEVKADGQYTDKYYEITGVISDIDSDYIVLEGEENDAIDIIDQSDVQCFFDDSDEEQMSKMAELNAGDKITVIGKIDGKSLNVIVHNTKIK